MLERKYTKEGWKAELGERSAVRHWGEGREIAIVDEEESSKKEESIPIT